jgi:uracil-DNA glycosylase family 4
VDERDAILRDLADRARYYSTLSSIGVPRSPHAPAPVAVRSESAVATPGTSASVAAPGVDASGAAGQRPLDEIREDIGDCQRCKLAGGRKTIVFGQGHPQARLMFVGEAPGADEDEQGLAFVGRAGQLLTRIIEAIGLRREDVFIANVLKCRPPGNRNPEPDEILSCQPFLERQIQAIRPRVIVGLGKFAGQWLLRTSEPISRIRGRLAERDGIQVMPTYHPAFLLRNPGAKKEVWADMKIVRSLLDE